MRLIIVFFATFLAAFLLTVLVRQLALRRRWLDLPNQRSSHQRPTARGGGAAFVLAVSACWLWLYWNERIDLLSLQVLLLGLPMALLGMLDDIHNLNVPARIGAQAALCLALVLLLGGLPAVPVGGRWLDFGLGGYLIAFIALLWLVNLYNFMDGIDGLAGLQAVFAALAAAALIAWRGGDAGLILACCALAAAVAGFLPLNLPPAKIFMGDVGSCFLGLALGALALLSMRTGELHLWSWAILLGVFIVDASFTLLRRLWRGDRWYQAHRSHAYQQAAARHGSHGKVDLVIILINFFWLFPVACFSLAVAEWALPLTIVAYIPLIFLGYFYNSGARVPPREESFLTVRDAGDNGRHRPEEFE